MKYALMLLVVLVSAAVGSAIGLFLETRIGFANTALVCATSYGTFIICTLLVIGVIATRNYIRDRETHRQIQLRLRLLGLP